MHSPSMNVFLQSRARSARRIRIAVGIAVLIVVGAWVARRQPPKGGLFNTGRMCGSFELDTLTADCLLWHPPTVSFQISQSRVEVSLIVGEVEIGEHSCPPDTAPIRRAETTLYADRNGDHAPDSGELAGRWGVDFTRSKGKACDAQSTIYIEPHETHLIRVRRVAWRHGITEPLVSDDRSVNELAAAASSIRPEVTTLTPTTRRVTHEKRLDNKTDRATSRPTPANGGGAAGDLGVRPSRGRL